MFYAARGDQKISLDVTAAMTTAYKCGTSFRKQIEIPPCRMWYSCVSVWCPLVLSSWQLDCVESPYYGFVSAGAVLVKPRPKIYLLVS